MTEKSDCYLKLKLKFISFRQDYLQWLQTTCQESAVAEVYERIGDYPSAVNMCLKAGLPSKAAK